MKFRPARLAPLLLTLALVAGGCGSDAEDPASPADDVVVNEDSTDSTAGEDTGSADDGDSEADDADATSTTMPTTTQAPETTAAPVETTAAPETETEPFEETEVSETESDADAAANEATSDDELIAFVESSLIDTDPEEAVACMREEAASEGVELIISDFEPILLALVRCNPEFMREQMGASFSEVDTSGISATPEQVDCSFEATMDYLLSIPLDSTVLSDQTAPQEMVDALVETCGVSESDAEFLLNAT